jgi:hypothetical protein
MSKLARVAVVRIEVTVKLGSRSATIRRVALESQSAGDERRGAGDGAAAPGTDGAFLGLSGDEVRAIRTGWLLGLAIVAMIMVFDILTRTHNPPGDSVGRAVVDEGSSAVVTAVMLALPVAITLWMRRRAPPGWGRALAYLAGAAVYPVLHVAGFVTIRKLVYETLLGGSYGFALPGDFLYEAAKDVPAFAFACGVFWLMLRWRLDTPQALSAPEAFDIRDGARLVRAPLAEILAVRSAGNYAEFVLADGRRPLMRSPLGALEARLAPLGFVRTHRSWLVNAGRVTGLRPEGSGDYAVELGAVEAPLSRRFPLALKTLRP